jgi:hypothetical protein
MTMMMARLCLHKEEIESCSADLESYGFTVLRHVYPNEADYVFVEATINIVSAPYPERVSSVLKVLGQADTISLGRIGTRSELGRRLFDLLRQLMPMASVTDAGPVPAGHIPFDYKRPPWTGSTASKAEPKLAVSEIEDMAEDDLLEINEKYDLGIDLDLHNTMRRKRNAIIIGLQLAKMLEA